jgi:hypothetical protein
MTSDFKVSILVGLIVFSSLLLGIAPVSAVQSSTVSSSSSGGSCQLSTFTGVGEMQYVKNCYYEIGVNKSSGIVSYIAIVDGSNQSIYDTTTSHGGAGLLTEELDGILRFNSGQRVSINVNTPSVVEEGILGDIVTSSGPILAGTENITFFANEPFFIVSMTSTIVAPGIHYGHDFANFVSSNWDQVWVGPGSDGTTTQVCNSSRCSTYSEAETTLDTAPDIKSLIQRDGPTWGWLGNSSVTSSNAEGVGFLLLGLNSTNPIESSTSHYELNSGDFEIEGTGVAPADYVAGGLASHNLEKVTPPQSLYGAFLVYVNAAPYTTFENFISGYWKSTIMSSYLGSSSSNAAFAETGTSTNPAGNLEDWYITNLATSVSGPQPSSANGMVYFTGRNSSLANDFPMKLFLYLNGHATVDSNFATATASLHSSGSISKLQLVWNDTTDGVGLTMIFSTTPNSDKINVTGSVEVTGSSLSIQTLSLEEKLFANYLDGAGLPVVSSSTSAISWTYSYVGIALLLPPGNGISQHTANATRGYLNLVNSTASQNYSHGKSFPFSFAVSIYDPVSNFSPNYNENIYVPITNIFTQPLGNASQVGFMEDKSRVFSYLLDATQFNSNLTIARMQFIKPFSGDLEVYYVGPVSSSLYLVLSNGTKVQASSFYNSQTKTFDFDIIGPVVWASLYATDLVSVSCSPASVPIGSQTNCNATVTGKSPTGTVSWQSNGPGAFSANTCPLSSSGSCSVTYTPTSNKTSPVTINASYSGDSNDPPTYGTFTLNVTLGLLIPKLTITCSPSTVHVGSYTTCTAEVTGNNPTGTVNFSSTDAAAKFSSTSCTLLPISSTTSSCKITYTPSKTGSTAIKATYSGDSNNPPSTSQVTLTVTSGSSYDWFLIAIIAAVVGAFAIGATIFVRRRYYY